MDSSVKNVSETLPAYISWYIKSKSCPTVISLHLAHSQNKSLIEQNKRIEQDYKKFLTVKT